MSYKIIKNLVDKSKYKIKCPYKMTPKYITVHNTDNNASAENEVAYMRRNNLQTSFHVAIDDKAVVYGVPFDRNAWHAGDGGNGTGNRQSIGVEICYSKSGGEKFNKAEVNASKWIAKELKARDWSISRVKRHKDWSGKNCPRRTMEKGWNRFLNMIQKELDALDGKPASKPSKPISKPKKIDVKYRAYAGGKWWANILNYNNDNTNGYAGVKGLALRALQANTVGEAEAVGKLKYRLGKLGGGWYNWITDRETGTHGDNYAGDKKNKFDRVQFHVTGAEDYVVEYRVYASGKWWSWIRDYNNKNINGYAGVKGKPIECIQVRIVKK